MTRPYSHRSRTRTVKCDAGRVLVSATGRNAIIEDGEGGGVFLERAAIRDVVRALLLVYEDNGVHPEERE